MNFHVYFRRDGGGINIKKFETLKEAADYICDDSEDAGKVWDVEGQRWLTGAEVLWAAVKES